MDLGYTIRIERAAAKMFAQRLHLAKTIRNPADRYNQYWDNSICRIFALI